MSNEALFAAVESNNLGKLKQLLDESPINVDAKDAKGETLLHHASSKNQREVVKFLLNNGADVLKTNDKDNTALHISVSQKYEDTTKAILENVARNTLRKLLDKKIKSNGNTALHIAVKNGCYTHVWLLLRYGANFEIENNVGQQPIDVASKEEHRKLFKLIDASYAKAMNRDESLIDDLKKCNVLDFTSVVNCRNRDGHSIMQVIILNRGDLKLSILVLDMRRMKPVDEPGFLCKYDRTRKRELEELAKKVQQCREFWKERFEASKKFLDLIQAKEQRTGHVTPMEIEALVVQTAKRCAEALKKAHEVLLAYWKFDGEWSKSFTANPWMRTVEETLEALGFDTEQLFVIAGEEACYYEKLPFEWKWDILPLSYVMDGVVYAAIQYFGSCHNNARLVLAIVDNDLEEVQKILHSGMCALGVINKVYDRTPLCYAAERGNMRIIRELLNVGAKVTYEKVVSPVYLAASKGHAEVVKLLLKNVNAEEMKDFIDRQLKFKSTALHVAAKERHLDVVNILLSYGATYEIIDGEGRTPLDVSSSEQVSKRLILVDECFRLAEVGDVGLVNLLKTMDSDEFLAVAGARNCDGITLVQVAAKVNAKSLATDIARMIEQVKKYE